MNTDQVNVAVKVARELAETNFFNNIISIEHLTLALLMTDQEVVKFFIDKHCDVNALKTAIANHIHEEYPVVRIEELNPQPSVSYKRVLERATFVAQYSNRNVVYGLDIIDAMFPERDSFITMLMTQSIDISREEVRHYCSKLHPDESTQNQEQEKEQGSTEAQKETEQKDQEKETNKLKTDIPESIEDCLISLTNLANAGKIDPVIAREKEFDMIYQALARRKKNNVIVVGQPGVGKTAIGEGLAYNIAKGLVPEFMKNFQIYSLDIGAAVAGTTLRGEYEKRLKEVVHFISEKENAILFIDEIHHLIGSLRDEDAVGGAGLIKNELAGGKLHCVATTTFQSYNQMSVKDAAFTRRFSKVDVDEPSASAAVDILRASKESYEKFHNVIYPENVLEKIVQLSIKYMHNRYLPDKAFDILDIVGAREKSKIKQTPSILQAVVHTDDVQETQSVETNAQNSINEQDETNEQNNDQATEHSEATAPKEVEPKILNEQNVLDAFSSVLNMPIILKNNDNDLFRDLNANLKKVVFGQDHAIDQICDAVIMNKSGLDVATHPIGSFLFAGPTGVGKTEVVVQLAKQLSMHLIRLDMSEYSSEYTVSKLLGSPPGYVGYEEGGVLTNQVKNDPNSVVLFDEIEKAHPNIYNILLQIMDNGIITDGNGVKVNFRNTIVVLTTNCGAAEMEKGSIGFISNNSNTNKDQNDSTDNVGALDSLKRTFTPEFRNRLDGIVWFNNLSSEIVRMVFDKLWNELQEQLKVKNTTIEITDSAIDELLKQGYDRTMGARPMRRALRNNIHKVLSRELLFGKLLHGGTVKVDFVDQKFVFDYVSNPSPAEDDSEQLLDIQKSSNPELIDQEKPQVVD